MLRMILLLLVPVAGGLGGFFLRRWELSTAFESTGLAIPWAPSSMALIALSAVVVVALALLCRGKHRERNGYDEFFAAHGNWAYLVVTAIAAAHLLLAGVFGQVEFFRGDAPRISRMFLALLCVITFGCVLALALNNFRGSGKGRYNFPALMPAYLCCLWLVSAYQQRAADPVVLDYVYELFAIIAALLGFYFTAGFAYERAKVWRASFFCLLSVYFSLVTLADGHDPSIVLLLRFVVLYQLAAAGILVYNAFVAKPKDTQEVTPDE